MCGLHAGNQDREVLPLMFLRFARSPEIKQPPEYMKSSSYSHHNQSGSESTLASPGCLRTRVCNIRIFCQCHSSSHLKGYWDRNGYYKSWMNALTSTPSVFLSCLWLNLYLTTKPLYKTSTTFFTCFPAFWMPSVLCTSFHEGLKCLK